MVWLVPNKFILDTRVV